jgi:hypothetical protein
MKKMMVSAALTVALATSAFAHPGPEGHDKIWKTPTGGIYNDFWYDYRSDVEEAENELRKDMKRAKTAQDRAEAQAEYRRELADAKKDYSKEMAERGYRRGQVIMGSR